MSKNTFYRSVPAALFCAFLVATLTGCKDKQPAVDENALNSVAAPPKLKMQNRIVLEAENMSADGCFEIITEAENFKEASGGQGARVPDKSACASVTTGEDPKPVGTLAGAFTLDTKTTVNIWVRVRWTSSCGNSFQVELPNGLKKMIGSSTYKQWIWLDAAKNMTLEPGSHKIIVHAREFETAIDQILIVENTKMLPRGIEQALPRK